MFNLKKEDRRTIEVTIQFNLTRILQWLKSGGSIENINKINHGWDTNDIVQKYVIDIIPIERASNAFYHRNKGAISQQIAGTDYLRNIDESLKLFNRKQRLQAFKWKMSRVQGRGILLMVEVDEEVKVILLTPELTEVVELENKGKIENARNSTDDTKMSISTTIDNDGKPQEFIDIWKWHGFPSYLSIVYGNGLGRVSFEIPHFDIEY